MFISKYALSSGIVEMQGKEIDGYFHAEGRWGSYKIGRDAHFSMAEALPAAESARRQKIESLEKQIKKLQAMKFA